MFKEFTFGWEGEIGATPQRVWSAITKHSAGWQWHVDYEPRVGGAERGLTPYGGTVTAWEPTRHFATRAGAWCGGDGGFNELDITLEPRGRDATYLHYRHRTEVPEDEYAVQLDACRRHTAFYLHSLDQYVRHFADRDAVYVSVDGPESSTGGGFRAVLTALGLSPAAAVGDRVTLRVGAVAAIDGVVDFTTDVFLGVRSADALYRFYGRDEWGWPVGLAHHLFAADAEHESQRQAWATWLHNALTTDKAVA